MFTWPQGGELAHLRHSLTPSLVLPTESCSCDLQTCLSNSHNPAVFGVVLAVLVAVPLVPVVVVVIVAVTKRRRGKYYAATQ